MTSKRDILLNRFMAPFSLAELEGIEIGPFDRPFMPRSEYPHIRYADVFSTAELKKHASLNPNRDPDAVVPVDFVLRDNRMSEVVPSESMDFVFCSHVLEHVPDFIGSLKDIEQILRPGGLLICAFPDRRFTFDIDRSGTTMAELRDRHERRIQKPDPETVFDFFKHRRPVFVGRIWQKLEGERGPRMYTEEYAREKATEAAEKYIDCHCNVMSDEELRDHIGELSATNILNFDIDAFQPTTAPLNEFYFVLRKKRPA